MRLIDADVAKKLEHMLTLKPSERALFRLMLDRMPTYEPPNDPLTLEELREMNGEPVYLYFGEGCGEWVFVQGEYDEDEGVSFMQKNGIPASFRWAVDCGGKLYRRKPEEGTV